MNLWAPRVQGAYPSVKILSCSLLVLSWFFSSCTLINPLLPRTPNRYGPNDYAVGEAGPYPQEVQLAKQRLQNFIRRANASQKVVLDRNPNVAVQAYEIRAGEDWPLLRKLASGRVRTTLYVQDFRNLTNFPVKFLLIFDWRTQQLVRNSGVLVMDTPNRGSVGEFAGIRAIYAGTGWWSVF